MGYCDKRGIVIDRSQVEGGDLFSFLTRMALDKAAETLDFKSFSYYHPEHLAGKQPSRMAGIQS